MNGVFMICFSLCVSFVVVQVDGAWGWGFIKQAGSLRYAMATGKVTLSRPENIKQEGEAVQYSFEVGGRTFIGTRVRYAHSDWEVEKSAMLANPIGAAVPVFYDPENPQNSLLMPGLRGKDTVLVLFVTPFNLVMLGLWIWVAGWLRERLFHPVAGGVKIIADGSATRVRLPHYQPVVWGLATSTALGFVSLVAMAVGTNFKPSLGLGLADIGLIYLAGIGVFLWRWWRMRSGVDDLVLHETNRTLELPPTFGRKQRATVNFADIKSFTVEEVEHRNKNGGVSYTYEPTLYLRGPEAGTQTLADWSDEVKAEDFAKWLRHRLGKLG